MQLYIRQKVFSWNDKFYVKDRYGNDKYYVEGELFSFGKKLHVYDMAGNEVAYIEQKVFSFLPKYYVYINGVQMAEVVKEFTFLFPRYTINGAGWTWDTEGSFMAHDYQITCEGRPIVEIHKEWMTWGDCYQLDIAHPDDEILSLAVVLTIDCVIASQSNN